MVCFFISSVCAASAVCSTTSVPTSVAIGAAMLYPFGPSTSVTVTFPAGK